MWKRLLAIALAGIAFAAPAHAQTYTFNWSFTDDYEGNTVVSGTISGLVEGNNSGQGLIIDVVSGPSSALLGSGWVFEQSYFTVPFTVTNGVVTRSDGLFSRDNQQLFFADSRRGYDPSIVEYDNFEYYTAATGTSTRFSAATAAAPEPAAWAMMIGGFAVVGGAMRRRRKRVLALAA